MKHILWAALAAAANSDGYFDVKLGCTPNASVKVAVSASITDDTYAHNEDGKWASTSAIFYAKEEVTIADGSAHAYNLILLQVGRNTGLCATVLHLKTVLSILCTNIGIRICVLIFILPKTAIIQIGIRYW